MDKNTIDKHSLFIFLDLLLFVHKRQVVEKEAEILYQSPQGVKVVFALQFSPSFLEKIR